MLTIHPQWAGFTGTFDDFAPSVSPGEEVLCCHSSVALWLCDRTTKHASHTAVFSSALRYPSWNAAVDFSSSLLLRYHLFFLQQSQNYAF
jgi:hypothetical protein